MAEAAGKWIAKKWGGDDTWDASRILKVPGTIAYSNDKKIGRGYPEVAQARIYHIGPDTLSPDEVTLMATSHAHRRTRPKSATRRVRATRTRSGGRTKCGQSWTQSGAGGRTPARGAGGRRPRR